MKLGPEGFVVEFRSRYRPFLGHRGVGLRFPTRRIALNDLVHEDVAERTVRMVEDADARLLSKKIPHLPINRGEILAVYAGGSAHGLAIHQQRQKGLPRQLAATN